MNTVERNPRQRNAELFATLNNGDDGNDPLAEQARGFLGRCSRARSMTRSPPTARRF